MKDLKQELAIGHSLINRTIKNNLSLVNYNNNAFIKSLKKQLETGKPLTTAQKNVVKKMDTMGNFKRAMKK